MTGARAGEDADMSALATMPRSERVEALFGFSPFDYQADVLDAAEDAPDGVTVTFIAGRQVGKSTCASAIPADYALTHPGADVLVCARFQEQADELFRQTKQHLEAAGLDDADLGLTKQNASTYEFANGARIMSRTLGTDARQQRGKKPKCVVVEEAALVSDDIFEEVIEPMFSTHDDYELYLISTPRGKQGYVYEKHVHDDAVRSFHVPTTASPLVDEGFVADRREQVDDLTFRQEYLGEFVESDSNYLPLSLVTPSVRPEAVEAADADADRNCARDMWLGVDVARAGSDRSVFLVVDDHGVVREIRTADQQTVPEAVDEIQRLDELFDLTAVLIDENAVGGGVVDFSALSLGSKVAPVTFTSKSKQAMFSTLKRAFEDGSLSLPDDDRLVHELTSLQYDFTQHGILRVKHPPGGHDDYADALALAVYGMETDERAGPRRVTRSEKGEVPKPVQFNQRTSGAAGGKPGAGRRGRGRVLSLTRGGADGDDGGS